MFLSEDVNFNLIVLSINLDMIYSGQGLGCDWNNKQELGVSKDILQYIVLGSIWVVKALTALPASATIVLKITRSLHDLYFLARRISLKLVKKKKSLCEI